MGEDRWKTFQHRVPVYPVHPKAESGEKISRGETEMTFDYLSTLKDTFEFPIQDM